MMARPSRPGGLLGTALACSPGCWKTSRVPDLLPLLQNGSCSIRTECQADTTAVAPRCPQVFKCGSCVMWSPRGASRTGRNEGQCLLDRASKTYLDCNAPGCPYYRPRRDSPAALEARTRRQEVAPRAPRSRLGRDAPDPSPAAMAMAAASGLQGGVLVELMLEAASSGKLPALLERFRGGTAILRYPDGSTATQPVERWFLWVAEVKRGLDQLEQKVTQSALPAEDREKIIKDIKGMRGSLTTFNLLIKDKEDQFVGAKA